MLDGNLVLYHLPSEPIWASCTVGTGAVEAILQEDGNFIIYDGNHNSIWQANTIGYTKDYIILQDDGNLVIYNVYGGVAWATYTNSNSLGVGCVGRSLI